MNQLSKHYLFDMNNETTKIIVIESLHMFDLCSPQWTD